MMPISSMEEFNGERWNQLGFVVAVFVVLWILRMLGKIGERYIDQYIQPLSGLISYPLSHHRTVWLL
jgi:hypothetical protein